MKWLRMSLMIVLVLICAATVEPARAASTEPLTLNHTVDLEGFSGRIGRLCLDTKRIRLFIAVSSTNTVEILDLNTKKRVPLLTGLGKPFDVIYMPDFDLIAISSGGNGAVYFFDAETLKERGSVSLGRNASYMQYDAAAKELFVVHGAGTLAVIDVATQAVVRSYEFEHTLSAFRLESGGNRAFINRSGNSDILVINRKTGDIIQTWPIEPLGAGGNMTMALDEQHDRLFVGCRKPSKMLVLDTADGRLVKSLGLIVDCEDVHYDAATNRAYASCGGGGGAVDVFEVKSPDEIVLSSRVPTRIGGRASFFDQNTRRLYVMTPADRLGEAKVLVLQVEGRGAAATQPKPAPPATRSR